MECMQLQNMFDQFLLGDLDKNGVFSRNEFILVISCAFKMQCQKTCLTITCEFPQFFRGAEGSDDNESKRMFTVFDKDKNRKVSFSEMLCNPFMK